MYLHFVKTKRESQTNRPLRSYLLNSHVLCLTPHGPCLPTLIHIIWLSGSVRITKVHFTGITAGEWYPRLRKCRLLDLAKCYSMIHICWLWKCFGEIELAARRIVWGKLINCGQTCVAPDYIYVHKSIKLTFPIF